MASLNRATLIGNIGKDPELRYTASGAATCTVSLATSRSWKNEDTGERQEETEWSRVVFFDRLAEIAGEYLKKGRSVYVEGRLKTRKWADKDGIERYTTEIIATDLQMLGGKGDDAGASGAPAAAPSRPAAPVAAPAPRQSSTRQQARPATSFDDMDDDIPF